jgi:Ni/Co efflux regulator RcnB
MTRISRIGLLAAAAFAMAASSASAQDEQHHQAAPRAPARAAPRKAEPYSGPTRYQAVTQPQGLTRPAATERNTYQHNYQASRSYRVGPYRAPAGFRARSWAYGQILPRLYWASQYILAYYWLFNLEVPPMGCEWVRYGDDALLVDTSTGEILQVQYGVFA